jgi:glyoxylase-like metal-dependent hydrolase (beta-lactamase superfamily II)
MRHQGVSASPVHLLLCVTRGDGPRVKRHEHSEADVVIVSAFSRVTVALVAMVALLITRPVTARATGDDTTVIEHAAVALGVEHLRAIRLIGSGSDFLFGQAYDGHSPWPRFQVSRYVLDVDYEAGAVREERVRHQAQDPPRGGGNQPIAEQRQVWAYRDGVAWNGEGPSASRAGLERDRRTAAEARRMWLALTPHGFVRLAQAAGDTAVVERRPHSTIVRVPGPDGTSLVGELSLEGDVRRVETRHATPVLGDTIFEALYFDYHDAGAFRVPRRVVHRQGGYPILDIAIEAVDINEPRSITVPAHLTTGPVGPIAGESPEELAPGVWRIALGPRDRVLAVEFRDHVLVVEAPQGEPESLDAIRQIRTVMPDKPIRYVVNTHIHFDHSGGLRTYAAEGAAIVTHVSNVGYYEQVWSQPRTISPDRLAQSGRTPTFIGVTGMRTFTDGERRVDVYHYGGTHHHHPGMLMVHLPAERLLVQADSFNPPGEPEARPNAVPNLVDFLDAVDRLRLDVDVLVPTHGRLATLAEARRAAARFAPAAGGR